MADPTPDPLLGRVLDGRYAVEHVVARGGMATVYVGRDLRLDRTVAVKVMHRALADDPAFVERFTREARAAAQLNLPEVVAVFDQGRDDATGLAYLVMELVRGRTLRDLLRERGALPAHRAVQVMEPVLRALAAAHAAGLVHRDVKPENVLLADDGRVKVADFGLARAVEASTLTATTSVLLGTAAYLAPEQVGATTPGAADPRSDVYAAGVVLFELLTGVPPYSGDTALAVAYRHLHEDVPPPSSVVASVPRALDELVVRATAREPGARPVDAGALLAELQAVKADLGLGAVEAEATTRVVPLRPPPAVDEPAEVPLPRARRPRRRRALALWTALVVVVAAVAGTGWWLGSGRWTEAPSVLELPRAQAVSTLQAAGLEVRFDDPAFDEEVPKDSVLQQDPRPGRRVRKDGAVTLVLSRGPDRRAVPRLAGLPEAEAGAALTRAGLVVGRRTEVFSTSVARGRVVSSDPAAGARLRPGAAVALVVSKGLELLAVPDVRGRPEAEAEQRLRDAGFRSRVERVYSDTVPAGAVVSQQPQGGTAPRGSTVALQVSRGPELVEVPDVRGEEQEVAEQRLAALGLKTQVRSIPGPGIVRDQDPDAGTRVRKGTTVTLYVF